MHAWDRKEIVGRMMALFTEMRSPDGRTSIPICAVLYDHPEPDHVTQLEGIPVFHPKYYGKMATPRWGQDTTARFFWLPK